MNAPIIRTNSSSTVGVSTSHAVDTMSLASPVGAGALARGAWQRLDGLDDQTDSGRPNLMPQVPARSSELVTVRVAEAALNRILSSFGSSELSKSVTVAQLEHTPMEAMNLAASLLGVKALGDMAGLKALALEIRTKGVESIRQLQNEELRKQVDKSILDAQKAKEAAIFNVVVDWIISVAEVATGAAKLICGDFAGGTMDIAAGCAGLVKAIVETIALGADEKSAKELHEIADVAGKIQLAFEIAGVCVDIVSVGRGVMATKSIANTTETVLKDGAGEMLCNALNSGRSAIMGAVGKEGISLAKTTAKELIKDVSEQIATVVAQRVTDEVKKTLAESSLRFMGQNHLIAAFSEQAIKKIVSAATENVAKRALKDVTVVAADELIKRVVEQVTLDLMRQVFLAAMMNARNSIKAGVRGGLQGANSVGQGEIGRQRAEVQRMIQQLTVDSSFVQFFIEEFEKRKEQIRKDISHFLEDSGMVLANASESQNKVGAMLSNIAHNIA
ncbi:type III secretion system translocon subunit SctE [Caballeronia sp. EK]|uniref:type III secretion system translocon subunit SctE n=1 Tax=Caballeronia sp. EK TaxID=2767469 RepID=UPI0016567576|nr:type III secretion system translocon subunit SctE [Caballeronia sp. EK]MBC8642925.1 type III secretion system translocon subunit SctE [Caballeronia sp. EK]